MAEKPFLHPKDLRGLAKLVTQATEGVTDVVESMHRTIARSPLLPAETGQKRTTGIAGLVYQSIRGVNAIVGEGLERMLQSIEPMVPPSASTTQREIIVSVLNGVLGDHLEASGNPLAIDMRLRVQGEALDFPLTEAQRARFEPSSRILIGVHGLCMNDLQWQRKSHNHLQALAEATGYTPLTLHYNSGRHISVNGESFSMLLDRLVANWPAPVDSIVIVGHSMGGLVTRSALDHAAGAGMKWLDSADKVIMLGSPHQGALLEKAGNILERVLDISRYSSPLVALGQIRSAGITDLRHGSVSEQDWASAHPFERVTPHCQIVPIPEGVSAYVVAGVHGKESGLHEHIVGDGLVPISSALGHSEDPRYRLNIPSSRQAVFYDTHHMALLDRPDVTEQMRRWMMDEC